MLDLPVIDKIYRLERLIMQLPQVEMPITHEFCDGIYARTMEVPAGVVLTGAIHKHENFLLIRSGHITVWTEDGMRYCFGGDMVKSKAGIKRVGYTHTNVVMTTFHFNPMNETDPETLWEIYTVENRAFLNEETRDLIEAL